MARVEPVSVRVVLVICLRKPGGPFQENITTFLFFFNCCCWVRYDTVGILSHCQVQDLHSARFRNPVFCHALQVQIDVRQAEALFDVLDYNNSGALDSEEFLEARSGREGTGCIANWRGRVLGKFF